MGRGGLAGIFMNTDCQEKRKGDGPLPLLPYFPGSKERTWGRGYKNGPRIHENFREEKRRKLPSPPLSFPSLLELGRRGGEGGVERNARRLLGEKKRSGAVHDAS